MMTTERTRRTRTQTALTDRDRSTAIRAYVRAYVQRHGRQHAATAFGVSRTTLWRCLARGHVGRALPRAVLDAVGGSVAALKAATRALASPVPSLRPTPATLSEGLEDTLLLLCAAPLATVRELSSCGRLPASTLRDRLAMLTQRGLVDSVPHRLGLLGPHPQRRYFPTPAGLTAARAATADPTAFLYAYPVSRQWFRLLAARLDAVAVLYHVAALVAAADPHGHPVRVDHCRQGPYDALVTLSGGRSLGMLRQGPMLPTANLRYRLHSLERLGADERPTVTLLLTYADQATRRAIRAIGDPRHHRTTFVATEGELLAGGAAAVVWQQGGTGVADHPPAPIVPDAALADIVAWIERLLARASVSHRPTPTPDPDALYPADVRATLPEPARQLTSALAVQLTRVDKETLDLLAAWPRCTRQQLAGLMGRRDPAPGGPGAPVPAASCLGTCRRPTVRPHRRRAQVPGAPRPGRRGADPLPVERPGHHPSPQPSNGSAPAYAGTALRALATQLAHQAGLTAFAAALTAEASRAPDYELFDLLPTARSAIGYWHLGTPYVVHPDASFVLAYRGHWQLYCLEFERRATTPRRIPARLESYRRYFQSGWAARDHDGQLPRVLFVFESPADEAAFLRGAATVERPPSAVPTSRCWPSGACSATPGAGHRRTAPTGGRCGRRTVGQHDHRDRAQHFRSGLAQPGGCTWTLPVRPRVASGGTYVAEPGPTILPFGSSTPVPALTVQGLVTRLAHPRSPIWWQQTGARRGETGTRMC